jgi:hypothetical protein
MVALPSHAVSAIATWPSGGVNFTALLKRLPKTCCMRETSTLASTSSQCDRTRWLAHHEPRYVEQVVDELLLQIGVATSTMMPSGVRSSCEMTARN